MRTSLRRVWLPLLLAALSSAAAGDPLLFGIAHVRDVPGPATEEMVCLEDGKTRTFFVEKVPVITARDVVGANLIAHENSVEVLLNDRGRQAFAELTREAMQKNSQIAIIYDGRLVTVPYVRSEITGGSLQISGCLTRDEALQMKSALNKNWSRRD